MNIKASHGKIYAKHFGYGEQDIALCENCQKEIASDIHHIRFKSRGGEDSIENLMALCRKCHKKAHFEMTPYLRAEYLSKKHAKFLKASDNINCF